MRICWAHSPEVRPSFRLLKDQLINVSQGLLNDWLSLLHCLRLSSPTGRSIGISRSRSPLLSDIPSSASRSSGSFSSATLPASLRVRSNSKYLPSVEELRNLSISLKDYSQEASSSDRVSLSSSSTVGCPGNQPSSSSSNSPKVCDICSSYGRTWIEICKIIRAAKGNWIELLWVNSYSTKTWLLSFVSDE